MATDVVEDRRATGATLRRRDPRYQAFVVLWIAFAVAPVLFGLDKFFGVMVDWEHYLAEPIRTLLPVSATTAMYMVGAIEVTAGLLVAVNPRFAYLVAAWLLAIVVNLLIGGEYWDIALRDFGLAIGAFSLGRQARGWRVGAARPEE